MDEWVAHIAASVGIAPAVARLAVGHVFGFLQKRHPNGPADELIEKIPGAEAAIWDAAAAPRRGLLGGVLGGVGGLVGGAKGDVLACPSSNDLRQAGLRFIGGRGSPDD